MAAHTFDRSTQDVGNLVALEHVNVTVPDQELAALFYVTGLGFTRDPYIDFGTSNMWINVGAQQFHLPRSGAQVLRGVIGLVVPSLDDLRARLARLEKHHGDRLAGSAFGCRPGTGGTLDVTCPWGNRLRIHQAGPDDDRPSGGLQLGMAYVDFDVAPGHAPGIARFYRELVGAPATVVPVDGDGSNGAQRAEIRVGCAQHLRFTETGAELPAYDGHHIAVYLANFSGPYDGLRQRQLVTMETNDHEYRFQDIVDLDTGSVLATVEHEVRSMFHPLFGRELVNRDPTQRLNAYRPGADRHVGVTHAGLG